MPEPTDRPAPALPTLAPTPRAAHGPHAPGTAAGPAASGPTTPPTRNPTAPSHSRLFGWLVWHWVCTYALMGLGFLAFGASSLHLAQYVAANLSFLGMHGLDAIMDGGLWQSLELLLNAYAAVAFYLLFKTCEHALVERLAHPPAGH